MNRFTKAVVLVIVVGLAAILLASVYWAGSGTAQSSSTKYHCPMHPTYVSEKLGDCPICGMRLVPMEEDSAATPKAAPAAAAPAVPANAGNGGRTVRYYRSPMNPAVTSPVPAKDEMGMDFVAVYDDEASQQRGGIPGLAPVTVTSEARSLAGLQTAPAVTQELHRKIRTVGNVVADETRVRHVHTKLPGWIEKLHVNFTGQLVKQGEPILSIYSPELLATQEEYLRTRVAAGRFASSSLPEVQRGSADLLQAARRRLELYDVPAAFIAGIERTGKARRTVTLDAPASGFVTAKDVFEGQQIEPGTELYILTDLSRVWIDAALYEFDAQSIKLGTIAHVTLPYQSGGELTGKVSFISPYLTSESRTLRARIEVDNLGLALKPSMFANVELEVDGGSSVVIPDSALMDTGDRQVVFVEASAGRFEPREVKVGVRDAGRVQILSGVASGEQVVVRANFLLDSESRLRAAVAPAAAAPANGGSVQ
ncbi:MAG: efflux RND transporter periplasmic adaptor subunit [Acidobacteriota bacterium]